MAKGIQRQLNLAHIKVCREIEANASGGKFAAGLSAEGYAGGYLEALHDIQAALNGCPPYHSRFWPAPNEE